MAINEEIVTGRKFRKLIDEANKLWQRISFWTKASDVEFDDGQTAETKIRDINGALSTLNSKLEITKATLAAGATSVTISDSRITTNSALSFYTSVYGTNPTAVSVANGSVTLTFDAQDADMEVGVRVDGE